jgi:uncharacterized lipoprotein YmbA
MPKNRRLMLLGLALLCVHVVGCARTQATRFYTLTPVAMAPEDQHSPAPLSVGVGPVVLPEYLDRPQMVGMVAANELGFSEFSRWAEPLDAMLLRVFRENLAVLLGTEHVAAYPWPSGSAPDAKVAVEVLSFVGRPEGGVVLDVRWVVQVTDRPASAQRTTIEKPSEAGDYASLAAAASRAVADLSREIADAIASPAG